MVVLMVNINMMMIVIVIVIFIGIFVVAPAVVVATIIVVTTFGLDWLGSYYDDCITARSGSGPQYSRRASAASPPGGP